jgi:simple sugar transport system substrate-binding protein
MIQLRRHPVRMLLLAMLLVVAAACSSTGGKQEEAPAAGANAGKANTPEMTVQMVTHGAPGDTFWDIIRKGAEAAAAKDNVKFQYSSDPDSGKQATLIQNAIDSKVDAIAVTLPDPPAIAPTVKKAVDAGIPVVAFNAGIGNYAESGAMSYFGSDESLAGEAAGKRASEGGYKNLLCVIQFQGQVQLEARCDGVKKTFSGKWQKIYVNGADRPSEQSTIAAKLKQDPNIDFVVTTHWRP